MLASLFERGLAPHGLCLLWQPGLLWLHAVSDAATGLAYFAIPIGLAWLMLQHRELAFGWMFWLFALFIVACGVTHFMDVWVLWVPDYGVQGLLKAFTAVASIVTAGLLWRIMPRLLTVPTPAQFQLVTDRLSAETIRYENTVEQLRRTEEKFQLLVESVRDCAMYGLDTAGHVTSWNAGAQHIKQYRADEIIGRHFGCFYTDDDQVTGKPMQALQTASRAGSYQEEGWRVRKDGSRFMADVVINPIVDRTGMLVGFAKITRDITQRKQAEADLEQVRATLAQSQKMEAVGQLTGGIAHDFNNMLAAIVGSLELLDVRREAFSRPVMDLLQVIRHAAEAGAELTGRLLAFSRKQALTPVVTDINQLVSGLSELLRRTLGASVSVETIMAGGLWPTSVDPNQLESAALNLAVNARDAMPHGGTLTIQTSNVTLGEDYIRRHNDVASGDYICIGVTDTGGGMTPEVLARAFEPFFTTKEMGSGTGLGLSQVYGFAKQSGGNVEIFSTLGQGTTVRMYFPRLAEQRAAEATVASQVAEPIPRGTEAILVVEDDDDVRGYSVRALRHLGYTVLQASDAREALVILDARPDIRLLFTDIGLPGMNGRELADVSVSVRSGLKVVYTSGYVGTGVANFGLTDSGTRLLPKPFRIESLARMLRSALDAS